MNFTLLGTKNPERVTTGVVSSNFFDVLGVKPVLGRLFTPADESRNAPPALLLELHLLDEGVRRRPEHSRPRLRAE